MKKIQEKEMEVVKVIDNNFNIEKDENEYYISKFRTIDQGTEIREYHKVKGKISNYDTVLCENRCYSSKPDFINEYWCESGKVKSTYEEKD